jgi:hypothetical protein
MQDLMSALLSIAAESYIFEKKEISRKHEKKILLLMQLRGQIQYVEDSCELVSFMYLCAIRKLQVLYRGLWEPGIVLQQ